MAAVAAAVISIASGPVAPIVCARITVPSEHTAATERSMPPVRMTNICPSPSSRIGSAWAVTTERAVVEKKLGSAIVTSPSRTSSSAGGPAVRIAAADGSPPGIVRLRDGSGEVIVVSAMSHHLLE